MNRFAHDNIDPSLTMQRRLRVMTPVVGPSKLRGRKSKGYDRYAGERLERRRHTYDAMDTKDQAGYTRPGSMNRKKVG